MMRVLISGLHLNWIRSAKSKCDFSNTTGSKRTGVEWPPFLPVYPCAPAQLSGTASLYQSLLLPWLFEMSSSFLHCLSFHLFCDLLLSHSLSNFISRQYVCNSSDIVFLEVSETWWISSFISCLADPVQSYHLLAFFLPLKWFAYKRRSLWISHQTLESPRSSSKLLFLILIPLSVWCKIR